MGSEKSEEMKKQGNGSIQSIFMHADGADIILMALGFLGAIGDGLSMPVKFLVTSKIMNSIGSASSFTMDSFLDPINKNIVLFCYMACGIWVSCFLEGYCWARTAQRRATRLRTKYLKAVLRQDVGYFDLHATSLAEVITTVSSDSLVIQDVLSEKVPSFLMNVSAFLGAYILAFATLWRLAIVVFPFVILLVIPGLMYGRALMSISRKIRAEYCKAYEIAEQAISSVRTVYSFVGERDTVRQFSRALQGSVTLGLKQGSAKGLAIGSNGIVYAMWSFVSYYGSRMVMYHGAKGGTVFGVLEKETYHRRTLGYTKNPSLKRSPDYTKIPNI